MISVFKISGVKFCIFLSGSQVSAFSRQPESKITIMIPIIAIILNEFLIVEFLPSILKFVC